jgi:anionic cell wall polymer biosynthesis LytR-Cps2A-Psr (LCP) family protein
MKLTKICTQNFQAALSELMNQPLDGVTSYKLAKVLKKVNENFDTFNPVRVKLAEKYAEKDKDGKPIIVGTNYKFSEAAVKEFEAELEEIDEEVDLGTIPLSAIVNARVSPVTIHLLSELIAEK